MNRAQFQKWLDQFPEDTEIEVMIQSEPPAWQSWGESIATVFDPTTVDEPYDYTDFTGNQFVGPDHPCYNKRILTLGTKT